MKNNKTTVNSKTTVSDAAFNRCIDFMTRMIEKYANEINEDNKIKKVS